MSGIIKTDYTANDKYLSEDHNAENLVILNNKENIETQGWVNDTEYGSSWDGDTTTSPSKNSVYHAIQYLDIDIGQKTVSSGINNDVVTHNYSAGVIGKTYNNNKNALMTSGGLVQYGTNKIYYSDDSNNIINLISVSPTATNYPMKIERIESLGKVFQCLLNSDYNATAYLDMVTVDVSSPTFDTISTGFYSVPGSGSSGEARQIISMNMSTDNSHIRVYFKVGNNGYLYAYYNISSNSWVTDPSLSWASTPLENWGTNVTTSNLNITINKNKYVSGAVYSQGSDSKHIGQTNNETINYIKGPIYDSTGAVIFQ